MKVTLVVMTLNEIAGVKTYLPRILKDSFDQVLVVDGGSKDGTIEYARELGFEVVVQTRPGGRMAYIEMYPHVRGDIVVIFSPDGNSVYEDIPKMVAKVLEGYDLVIASRYKPPARSDDDTLVTGLANWAFTKMISLFGFAFTDALVMYRAYRRELPRELGLTRPRSPLYERTIGRYVSWEPSMAIRAVRMGKRIAEIPSNEPPRIGESKPMPWTILPTSRIRHFRVGLCFLWTLAEELFRWDAGGILRFSRRR